MELTFKTTGSVGQGRASPNLIQYSDTILQQFGLHAGLIVGAASGKANGQYESLSWETAQSVSPSGDVEHFEVRDLQGFGLVGAMRSEGGHQLLIYEFAFEMDRYLESGSIKHSLSGPISSFTLSLANPVDPNRDVPDNVGISERTALLSPGAKVTFEFAAGDSEPYEMGSFFIDKSDFDLLTETVSADGRNLIGKALADQTLDEDSKPNWNTLDKVVAEIFENANLTSDQYMIEPSTTANRFEFEPSTTAYDALKEIFKASVNWKVEELTDGTIVVGSPSYRMFTRRGTYTFRRGKDIFSRQVSRDDMSAYRRVCVHTSDYAVKVYKDVVAYTGWNLQAKKTLYVQMPDGSSSTSAELYATELAERLKNVGKVEAFRGPFRPHLTPGDAAHIVDDVAEDIGVITEVNHSFGKSGFFTEFVVDSGGRLGKGRLTDYISKVNAGRSPGTISYEEL